MGLYELLEQRLKQLEEQIRIDWQVQNDLEKTLRTETDPRAKLRLSDAIEEVKQRIDKALEEVGALEKRLEDLKTDDKALIPLAFSSLQVFESDVVTVDARGQVVKREKGKARYFTEDLGNGVTLEMVAIPGGTFQRGSLKNELPRHEVTVKPFFMGKYPVTRAQWRAIASLPKVNRDLNPDPSRFKGDKRPVERVSWYDAVEFCQRLSRETGREYRLPSEAEWEYACRAETTTPFHFGLKITPEVANCKRNVFMIPLLLVGVGETTEVGRFKVANAFGLYDMHGNVWEWCANTWYKNYEDAPSDGRVWPDYSYDNRSLMRGGS